MDFFIDLLEKYDSLLVFIILPLVHWLRQFYLDVKEELKQSKDVHLGLYNQIQHMNKQLEELMDIATDRDDINRALKGLKDG